MDRRANVELFEEIRREYELGAGTIQAVAKRFGVNRRMVRQVLKNAVPPERKRPEKESPVISQVTGFIGEILESDWKAPRKQRHTAHRIYDRVDKELKVKIGESAVRRYVMKRKREMGIGKGEIYVPQSSEWGVKGQIDWYEAWVRLDRITDRATIIETGKESFRFRRTLGRKKH
jgi:transposase